VCRDAVELVTDYLEGSLSRNDRKRFERHLKACPLCTAYVEQTKLAARVLGEVKPEPPTGETRTALIESFRAFRDTPDN
jgi:anti-sigma factor RsiW